MLILNHFNFIIIRDTTVVSKILMLHISKRSYPGFKQLLTFFNKLNTNNTSLISLRTLNMWKAQSNLIHRNYFLNKPSFIIQLPSHIAKISYLPLTYPYKLQLSGLFTLSDKERELLTENSLLGKELRTVLLTYFVKVIHNFCNNKDLTLEQLLEQGFNNLFGAIDSIHLSKELSNIMGHKIIPIIQHFTTIFWGNRHFTFKTLEILNKQGVKCESYEEQGYRIMTILELNILNKVILLLPEYVRLRTDFYLVNSEALGKLPIFFNEVVCKTHTGQRNADLLILTNNDKPIDFDSKYYYDIKSYVEVGFDKRRLSLFQPNNKTFKMLINDIFVNLKRIIHDNKLEKNHVISKLYKNIQDHKSTSENPSDLYHKIIKSLANVMFDKQYLLLKISISLDVGKDITFDNIYDVILKEKISILANDIEKLEKLFPKTSTIEINENETTIKAIITEIFPEEMRKTILDNFQTIVLNQINNE